jgi:hypothetical protein
VIRFAVVIGVLAVAIGLALIARRGIALRRTPISLPPGLRTPALFTSETCATCGRMRRMLDSLHLADLTEIVWEHEPAVFEAAGIRRVPVFVWSDEEGVTWRVDGVASVSRLERWLGGP